MTYEDRLQILTSISNISEEAIGIWGEVTALERRIQEKKVLLGKLEGELCYALTYLADSEPWSIQIFAGMLGIDTKGVMDKAQKYKAYCEFSKRLREVKNDNC